MRLIKIALVCAATAFFAGCEAAPKVTYAVVTKPEDLNGSEIDSYFLQTSRIRVASTAPGAYTISSVPVEATGLKLAIRPADAFGVSTHVNVAKQPNTDMVSEIGIEVIDKRVQYIEDAAGIIKAILPLAGFEAPIEPSALPEDYNLADAFRSALNARAGFPVRTTKGVLVEIGPVPPDAETLDNLRSRLPVAGNQFYYAACRSARVSVGIKESNNSVTSIVAYVKVADPTFVQRVALPVKGKVAMHTECGASVTTEKDTGVSSDLAIVKALATQAKAIKDAIDASNQKKDGKQ